MVSEGRSADPPPFNNGTVVRIYSRETLVALAQILDRASERIGRRIFLLSDEPYRRIRFDACGFVSPARVYPWTVVTYSYAKVLLAPGQRLGYLAVLPRMPWEERRAIRNHMFPAQVALGWCFPNAVTQYAIPDLKGLCIDMPTLAAKRNRMVETLETEAHHAVSVPTTANGWHAGKSRKISLMRQRVKLRKVKLRNREHFNPSLYACDMTGKIGELTG